MKSEERQLDIYDNLMKHFEKLSEVVPDAHSAQYTLRDAVYKDGALSRKFKRLIAMAVALGLGCTPCIIWQTKQAVEDGASKEEVLEAASVLLAIHGTSGYAEGWRVVKVLEELGMV